MNNDIKKLKEFQKWFSRYIKKGYGEKCLDFTWSCHVCHAHFVKDIFDDFVSETIETDKWIDKQDKKEKTKKKLKKKL